MTNILNLVHVLALDLSINCPGYCVGYDDRYVISGYAEQKDKRATIYSRIEKNLELIGSLVSKYQIEAVWMEDTMPSGRGKTSQMLIEQAGIVKYWCRYRKIPVSTFPITDIKKTVSGKGNADKDEMIQTVQSLGYSHITQNDEADAVAIWLTGLSCEYVVTVN